MEPLIDIKNLFKSYENDGVKTSVLFDINVSIAKGEFVAIMGPSGSGKSTLMHILGFLDKPSEGQYLLEGKNTENFDDDHLAEIRNKKIGFVFQSFNLLARTTVLENVELPLMYSSHKHRKGLAEEALAKVGLEHRMNYFSNQISGGQKQRVAIARALVNDPAVIFADEPTGNLDSKSGATVMSILQKLNDDGRTIILVTHDREVAEHAKRILTIKDGRIIEDCFVENQIRSEVVEE
jgi:putative ABC transport system ATP-binding protein